MFDAFSEPNTLARPDGGERLLADRDVRLAAFCWDLLLLLVPLIPWLVVFVASDPGVDHSSAWLQGTRVLSALGVGGLLVLQWILLSTRGQTLAKIAFGTRIERPDGSLPGFLRAVLVRNWIMRGPFGLSPALGVVVWLGGVLMILQRSRRCLHDVIAGTVVVYVPGRAS